MKTSHFDLMQVTHHFHIWTISEIPKHELYYLFLFDHLIERKYVSLMQLNSSFFAQ